jgi:hypothetical protein
MLGSGNVRQALLTVQNLRSGLRHESFIMKAE